VTSAAAGRRMFREYLRLEYSEENMLFWLAVEELRNEQDERRVLEQVRLIYEDFISILSPREVSDKPPAARSHSGPWQLQPKVLQIRVHNNLTNRH